MDKDKLQQYSDEFIRDFTLQIMKKPRGAEVLGGALAATAHIMVIVATRLAREPDKALELVTTAVSASFEMVQRCEKEMREAGKL